MCPAPRYTCTKLTALRKDPRNEIFILSIASSVLLVHMMQRAEIRFGSKMNAMLVHLPVSSSPPSLPHARWTTVYLYERTLLATHTICNPIQCIPKMAYYGDLARLDVGDGSFGIADAEGCKAVALEQAESLVQTDD